MRRTLLFLPVLLMATFLLWPTSGTAEDLPEAPPMPTTLSVAYYQDAYIRGGGVDGATIEMELTSDQTPLTCKNRGGYEVDNVLVPGPVVVSGGGFRCWLAGKDFHNPTKTESTTKITVYQVVNGVKSLGQVVDVTFRASRFSLEVDPPQNLPVDEPISFTGIREDGAGLTPIRIDWVIKRNGTSVFPEGGKRSCDAGEQADYDMFICYFDSDNPDDRVPPDSVEPMTVVPAMPAVFAVPAIQVSPAVLPDGEYSATLEEVVGDDVADSLSFDFTVGTGEPAPNTPPPPGAIPEGEDTFQTIPLAPLPTLDDPELIPDAPTPDPETTEAAPAIDPVDDDVLRILILAIVAFTVMAMSGARGLGAPRRLIEAPLGSAPAADGPLTRDATVAVLAGIGGEVLDGAEDDAGRARPFGNAWGDRSVTWRFPGWPGLDRLSRSVPIALAPKLPLVARISADGTYLRAALGVLWSLLPVAGVVLGTVAATSGGAAPLPPALGLVAALLVLAVLDASAGIAAVTAFALVTLARGGLTAEGLSFAEGLRGLMGLAALWFVAPLVAAAARPLRRTAEPDHVYSWDRFGDTVIAALISGWAVQGIVGALGDLTGRELAITSHADGLALLTIGAVVGRFLLEESVATLYPRRLHAVQESDVLPEPTKLQQVRGLVFRAALMAFFAGAFLGNCWQLWVGVAIFSIPQVLQLLGTRIPDIHKLASAVPRGVVQILVLVAVGTAIAYLVDSRGSDDQLTAIRQGFVLLAIPGATLELLSVFGGETPKVRWTWPKQLAGAGVVAVTAGLVLFLL